MKIILETSDSKVSSFTDEPTKQEMEEKVFKLAEKRQTEFTVRSSAGHQDPEAATKQHH